MSRPSWLITLLNLSGRLGARHRGPQTAHFDGQRFHNLDRRPHHGLRAFLKWQRERGRQPAWQPQPGREARPETPARVSGDELRVTYINHATLLIQHRGLNILTDPLWCQRTSPFSFVGPKRIHPPGLALDELPPINLILVSHNHYDHLDIGSLNALARRFPSAKVVTGLGNGELIRACGFADIVEIDWWQSLPLHEGMLLTGVPAQHWSARSRSDTNRTLWLGFVLESPDGPVLFPGDTGLGPEFALIRQRFGPMRFAALPIGAYEPRWFMRHHHMNPDDAVQAHQQLDSHCSMAIHFGTFRLSDEGQFTPLADLAAALQQHGVAAERFRAPKPGEQWLVPKLPGVAP
ncbi:MBL fold metallo-hydrolase [Pseudomonas sp. ZM23]|uniref:MBL fold metallo-hydrolase n=1 Tax=Pseudomonas triclosanedens TaxID=2961893 RepID=A0ABY7A0L7_9PSED|nr:MBL fold metallo-hydrolase [Pseudomonas triclosanedens]MCP8464057.1 MBL fold metallo-hydrolase [Pseudomonas triclosanedens]MCP8469141.1 MBL fold metallo-hydrolase [Pseudomonas triclosanedens]MCP8475863.1 MBL fold metallo-hydrolase [Pseudomonas triclosanedens]WAI50435.1 MBL fold metallo-hydrolase [Pseudomonas triclosanedens]